MYILAFILMFVFESLGAAAKGDFSGIAVIGKVLLGIGTFLFLACIFTGFSTDGSGEVVLISIIMSVIGALMAAKAEQ